MPANGVHVNAGRPVVTIAMPLNRGVEGATVQSLLEIVMTLTSRGIAVIFDYHPNGPIALARAELVGRMLATPSTHLLFLDCDISVAPRTILGMLETDLDCITCIYPLRSTDGSVFALGRGQEEIAIRGSPGAVRDVNGHNVLEIDGSGLGCTLIKRGVFETLYGRHPDLAYASYGIPGRTHCALFESVLQTRESGPPEYCGEDFSFYHRVKAAGLRVYAFVDAPIRHERQRFDLGKHLSFAAGRPTTQETGKAMTAAVANTLLDDIEARAPSSVPWANGWQLPEWMAAGR
jgi:hypothetical protein